MASSRIATWKLVAAYASFTVAAFVAFLYLTFPFETVRQRLVSEANNAGYELHIGKLGPGLLGVTAKDIAVKKRSDAPAVDGQPEGGALLVDKVSLRPALFPPGIAFRANLMDGVAKGSVGGLGTVHLDVTLDSLDMAGGNLKGFSGLDLEGRMSGVVDLSIPKAPSQVPGGGAEPDFGQASGVVALNSDALTVKGGTVTVPMYGTPTPMDLPRIGFGAVDARITFDKGAGTVEKFETKSEDLTLLGSGTLKLARKPEFSETNLELRLKAEPDFQKRLGMVGAGLSMMQADPKDPTFRMARITGFLGRPNFR